MSTPMNIDYNGLFEALRNFQKGDSRFKDIDFEASGINSIIKFLAANTSSAALSTYFAMNESFISTSEILENVQALVTPQSGYVPFGKKSSMCVCSVTITPSDTQSAPTTLTIPKNLTSMGIGEGKTLNFSPKNTYSAALSGGVYTFPSVLMLEGQRTVSAFTQNGSGVLEFEIPNKNIDISTLEVSVRSSSSDTSTQIFSRFNSAFQLGKDSNLYYLSMNRNGRYKIEFGDGVLSKNLTDGNIIYVSYIVSNGVEGDGVSSLIATSEVSGYGDIKITVIDESKGGAEPESIQTIQSKARTSQGMDGTAVANAEYELKLSELLPAFKIKAWGGEESNPPRPGYVMFTTYPLISEPEQIEVKTELDKVSVGSILTTYSDYRTFGVGVNVFYVSDGSSNSNERIETEIKTTVTDYSTQSTNFGGSFAPRQLENQLEQIPNIQRVYVSYVMESAVETSGSSFSFNYHRQIDNDFIASFTGDPSFDQIRDTGNGFYKFKDGVKGAQINVSVDYVEGTISLIGVDTSIVSCTGNTAVPSGDDFFLKVEPYELLEVNLNEVKTL